MSGKYQRYDVYKESGVYLVPTRCMGIHTDRAAVYNAARGNERIHLMKYQRYAAYKESGIEWLGDVPEHWHPLRFKYVLFEKKKTSNHSLDAGSISFGKVIY